MFVVLAFKDAVTPAAKRVVDACVIVGADDWVGAVGAFCAYTELTKIPAISVANNFLIVIFAPRLFISC